MILAKMPSHGMSFRGILHRHNGETHFSIFHFPGQPVHSRRVCNFLSSLEAVMAVFAVWQGCDQFRCKTFTHSRQTLDRVCFGKLIQDGLNFLFIVGNMFFQVFRAGREAFPGEVFRHGHYLIGLKGWGLNGLQSSSALPGHG